MSIAVVLNWLLSHAYEYEQLADFVCQEIARDRGERKFKAKMYDHLFNYAPSRARLFVLAKHRDKIGGIAP